MKPYVYQKIKKIKEVVSKCCSFLCVSYYFYGNQIKVRFALQGFNSLTAIYETFS